MDKGNTWEDPEFSHLTEAFVEIAKSDFCIGWRFDPISKVYKIVGWKGKIEPDTNYIDNVNIVIKPSLYKNFVKRQTPLIISDVTASSVEGTYAFQNEAIKRGWKTLVTTPIINDDKIIGFIDAYWLSKMKIKSSDQFIQTLRLFGEQASRSIRYNIFDKDSVLSQIQYFFRGFPELREDQDLRDRYWHILKMAVNMLNGTGGKLYTRIPNQERLQLQAIAGINSELLKVGDILERGQGIAGQTFLTNQPIITDDYSRHPNRIQNLSHLFESVIAVPIRQNNNPIGVLAVLDKKTTRIFSETDDIPVLQVLADLAGIVIRDRELYEDAVYRQRDQKMIADIIEKFNTTIESEKLLQNIVEQIKENLGCTHCSIFFPSVREGKDVLVSSITTEIFDRAVPKRIFYSDEPSLIWKVYKTGKGEIFHDATSHKEFSKGRRNDQVRRSILIAPIKVEGRIIGAISADQDQPVWFKNSDLQIVETLAVHAGIAIERQYGVETMERISQHLLEKINSTNLTTILREIISGALQITNMSSGIIHLFVNKGNNFIISRSVEYPLDANYPPPRLDGQKQPIGLTKKVIVSRKPIIISDTFQVPGVRNELIESHFSSIGLPLLYKDQVIGALFLDDNRPHEFHKAELGRLSTLTNQAAAAIKSSSYYETIQAIDEISDIIAVPTKIEPVLDRILELVNSLLGNATLAVIALVDHEHKKIFLHKTYGEEMENKFEQGVNFRQGVAGSVIRTKEGRKIDDVTQVKEYLPLRHDILSEIAVPIIAHKKIIGVLDINHKYKNAFSESDFELAKAIGRLTGIALKNAEIYEKEKARTNEVKRYIIGLAHELQLPLTSLIAGIEVLGLSTLSNEIRSDASDHTIAEAQLLALKVKTAIAVLSGETPKRKFAIHSLYRPLLDARNMFLREALAKGCQINYPQSLGGDFPAIEMVLDDLTSAFKNLVHNAVKYSYEASLDDPQRFVTIKGYWKDSNQLNYVVEIQNFGVGITPEEIKTRRIFKEFERGEMSPDRERNGSGFGLTHASQIIEKLHKGKIDIKSEKQTGGAYLTTVIVTLHKKQP